MLTGDQRLTADAVGREPGLFRGLGRIIDGHELDSCSEEELRQAVADVDAFSRVMPEHKLKIVSALQASGEIVAMLGDGINDAPALRKADVGVAMGGRGTDAARQAAAIVLRDDRFETIGTAIEEGRGSQPVTDQARAIANRFALVAAIVSVALQTATIYVDPLPELLRVSWLSPSEWLVVLLLSAVSAVTGQALKERCAHP